MRSLILGLINFFILFNLTSGRRVKSNPVEPRIGPGGHKAALKQFPWVGFLQKKLDEGDEIFCGASIIHPFWVLTAGHCCQEVQNADVPITFYAGKVALVSPKGQERQVVRFFAHENISEEFIEQRNKTITFKNVNDIGVAKLNASLKFNDEVKLIVLNFNMTKTYIGAKVTYMGWGIEIDDEKKDNRTFVYDLAYATGKVISLGDCRRRSKAEVDLQTRQHLCTIGDTDNMATCYGDSGGPLVTMDENNKPLQIGVITDVYCSDRPSVYMHTAKYFFWIREKLGYCGDEILDPYETRPKSVRKLAVDYDKCRAASDCSQAEKRATKKAL